MIDEIVINGPVVTHENGPSGNNIEVIEKNIQSYGEHSSPSKAPPKDSKDKDSGHKKFQINRLLIKNGRVLMNTALTAGKTIEMPLSDIELKDIGKGSNGATIQEVSSIVLASMMKGVSQAIASIGRAWGSGQRGRWPVWQGGIGCGQECQRRVRKITGRASKTQLTLLFNLYPLLCGRVVRVFGLRLQVLAFRFIKTGKCLVSHSAQNIHAR